MTTLLPKEELPVPGGDDLTLLLSEIRSFPLLDPEQELALARRCAGGDESAIRQMVNSNLRLVVSVARKYAGRNVPLMDLIQEGSIGLLSAAWKYDYTRNVRFSTYATKWIYRGILRCLMEHGQVIRIPTDTTGQLWKIGRIQSELFQKNGKLPSTRELAEGCGISEEKLMELLLLQPELCSLDAPAGEEEDDTLVTLVEDFRALQPHQELIRHELENTMDKLLSALTPRQQEILRLHFGMEDGECYSLEKISVKLGISKERVRQIEKRAMEKLQTEGANLGLEDFLVE